MSAQINFELLSSAAKKLIQGELTDTRINALSNIKDSKMPSTKNEEWQYTDISNIYSLCEKSFHEPLNKITSITSQENIIVNEIDAHWIIIKNGVIDHMEIEKLKEIGILVSLLSKNIDDTEVLIDDPLSSLNAALMNDAIKITISSDLKSAKPIGIFFENDINLNNYVSNFRCIFEVKDNASVSIIHAHTAKTQTPHFTNSVIQINMGKDSNVEYLKLQDFSTHQTLIEKSVANLGINANLNYTCVDVGAQLMRADIIVNFNEKNANANINGVYIAGKNQHIDNHILANHFIGSTKSSQNFYGVIGENGRCVFNGKALICESAINSNANQFNHNLLMSENAEINTKPELEIYTDDVTCSHGTTVGQLDENALFYMQSRGIDEDVAQQLLTKTFITRILNEVNIPSAKDFIENLIIDKLQALTQ
jgi:Fe-S cluster assembly protein SufD